jgi:hypothetical protein
LQREDEASDSARLHLNYASRRLITVAGTLAATFNRSKPALLIVVAERMVSDLVEAASTTAKAPPLGVRV